MPRGQPELLQPHIPAVSKHVRDAAKIGKLAQRVEQTLKDQVVFSEPKQLDPQSILVAPCNRDGAPPNAPHVHMGIPKGIVEKGYDSTRPSVGICV